MKEAQRERERQHHQRNLLKSPKLRHWEEQGWIRARQCPSDDGEYRVQNRANMALIHTRESTAELPLWKAAALTH